MHLYHRQDFKFLAQQKAVPGKVTEDRDATQGGIISDRVGLCRLYRYAY